MKPRIQFEEPFFDDIAPETKSSDEIILKLMQEAAGKTVDMRKYNRRELSSAARVLILNGFMRGTILGRYDCIWSRLTQKGSLYLKIIENENTL